MRLGTVFRAAGWGAFACVLSACLTAELQRPGFDEGAIEEEGLKQEIAALRADLRYERRIHRIGWPMLKNALDLCGEDWTAWHAGLTWQTIRSFPEDSRDAAREAFGTTEALQVRVVIPGGAGERAGVETGDILTAFDGEEIAAGEGALRAFLDARSEREVEPGTPITYGFERAGEPFTVDIHPDLVCDYAVHVTDDQEMNAYADGESIYFTRPIMRLHDDYGLAVIFGHELAHNVMSHVEKGQANRTAATVGGTVLDILAAMAGVNTGGAFSRDAANLATLQFSPDFESEADHVGLYVLAKGGYPVADAAGVWRIMASEFPNAIYQESTHPPSAERFLLLESVAAEIETKRVKGEPVFPDLPEDWEPKPRDRVAEAGAETPGPEAQRDEAR